MGEAARILTATIDPVAAFRAGAADYLLLDDLIAALAMALAAEGVAGHELCAVGSGGALVPLFGDAPGLNGEADCSALPLATDDGEEIAMLVTPAPADAAARATVHALAALAAAYGLPLLDAGATSLFDTRPSAAERLCLGGVLAGATRFDLADRIGCTPAAVRVHLMRARMRLDAGTDAEAVAVAMRRGFISHEG